MTVHSLHLLVVSNKSVIVSLLHLYNTSLDDDNIKIICISLPKNITIRQLWLSKQHRVLYEIRQLSCY